MDDQQVETEATESSSAHNVEQLEFLQFLRSLDEVPNEIGNVSNDGDNVCELEPELVAPRVTKSLPNGQLMDPELAIPHITISLPEGQFIGSELDSEQVIPQISISFSNLPPAVPAQVAHTLLDITERSKQQLQLEQLSLQKHHFVHKLYLATSSQKVTFLNWSADGQQLQLDYIGLQEHLSGAQSMFRSRNVQQFTRHILDLGFERVTQQLELLEERPQLLYQHVHFKPGQPELLLQLPTLKWDESQAFSKSATNFPLPKSSLAMHSESRTLSPHSPLQLARCRFQILLHYHNDVRLLQQQEPNAEQLLPRRGRISSSRQPAQVLMPSLASKHVNPRDSVLQFEVGQVPEYAGFYGQAEPALISEFFAEYLPRYGARVSGYKDVVVDASKANSFQQNLPIGIVYSEDEDDLEDQECLIAETKNDDCQSVDNPISLPEDIELEQVMQELCGVVPEAEEQLDKKEMTPPKPKLKRKKVSRKSATVDNDFEPESPQEESVEDVLEAAVEAASCIKDELKSKVESNSSKDNSKDDADKDVKCQTTAKRDVKRRRYDLRNSKSKRSN